MPTAPQILIIDDDAATVRLLVELLRGRGFLLRVTLDPREGHKKALENQPDVILLDVSMPHLDGRHVCRLLKDDPRTADIPVLFLTGMDGQADKLKGFGVGASDYITKPFHADELVARLKVHAQLRGQANGLPSAGPAQTEAATRAERSLLQAMEILRANLAEPPSLVDLARRVGSNERSLTELFRSHHGMPVFAWLREERYRHACHLLLSSDWDVGVVGAMVGYGNAAFASGFRERYGVTPSAYRRSAGLTADIEPGA
jgi:DNA-binding response OmpR family regulator